MEIQPYLSNNVKVLRAIDAQRVAADSAQTVNGVAQDVSGWDGALFAVSTGVMNAAVTFDVQRDDASGMASPVVITGTALAVVGTDDNKVHFVDVELTNLPVGEKFLRLRAVGNGTGAAGTFDNYAAILLLYAGQGLFPVAQAAEVVKSAQVEGV